MSYQLLKHYFMINTAPNRANCLRCNFDAVCTSHEQQDESAEKKPMMVKRYLRLQRKELLCISQRKFNHFYVIREGALKTTQMEANGKELIRGFYFANEVLGYEAIYPGHYDFSAMALTETLVCEIPYENFLKSVNTKPQLQKQALYLISKQMNTGSYLALTTAKQRVAAFLIDLSIRLNLRESTLEFKLPMSQQDIGNYLRLTAETVSRIFSRFQKLGLINSHRQSIQLLEKEQLQLIVDGVL